MLRRIIAVISLLLIFSCATKSEKRGYMFDLVDHNAVQEGVTSKERVLKVMGYPTLISFFDDRVWIYYSEDREGFLFFKPKVIAREILVLKFDQSDIVNNIQKLSLANETKELKFISDYTPVDSRKESFFKSIFSNVGQIKAN